MFLVLKEANKMAAEVYTGSPNSAQHRRVLQRFNCKLADNIDAKILLPYMKDVIDFYQVDQIYAEKNSFRQNEKLISFVSKGGPNSFSYFIKALDVCYPHFATQIRQDVQKNCDINQNSRTGIKCEKKGTMRCLFVVALYAHSDRLIRL